MFSPCSAIRSSAFVQELFSPQQSRVLLHRSEFCRHSAKPEQLHMGQPFRLSWDRISEPCITAILSAIGANRGAKRVAAVHLSFNIIGTIIFLTVFYTANAFVHFDFLGDVVNPANVAVIHSLFNVGCTLLLLPFTKALEKLAKSKW